MHTTRKTRSRRAVLSAESTTISDRVLQTISFSSVCSGAGAELFQSPLKIIQQGRPFRASDLQVDVRIRQSVASDEELLRAGRIAGLQAENPMLSVG